MSLCADKSFSLLVGFAWAEKTALFLKPKVFRLQKALQTSLKAAFLRTKTSLARAFLRCPLKFPFSKTNRCSFSESFTNCPQKPPFLRTKSRLFTQTFPYCYPKQPFFALRRPFQRPLTYCLQRMQLFFCCSLNSLRCKAGASHRFKSLPAIPDEVAASCKTGYLMKAGHFRKNHVSTGDLNRPRSPEVRKPLVYFWFFSYTRKE